MFDIFGNGTIAPPVNWQPGASTRGTTDILSTCLITLGLCLWSALHLNISQHGKSSQQKWYKCGWLLVGLFAPEMVAYTAWVQLRAARRLDNRMKQLLGEAPSSSLRDKFWRLLRAGRNGQCRSTSGRDSEEGNCTELRRHPWTMTHSFYAIMGGFAFDTSDAQPNFLPNHRSRLCISFSGLTYIAKRAPELIPDIAEKHIRDKSKADSLAKFLVCLQALWFCVQCMTRVTQRKAISLLELNTFAHAFCALLIYALWWHKPQDVEEPTLLQGEKQWEMCALLCMNCTKGDAKSEVRGGIAFGGHMVNGESPRMKLYGPYTTATKPASASDRIINPETNSSSSEEDPYRRNPPGEGPAVILKHGEFVYGFQCQDRWSGRRSHDTLRIEPPHLRRLELYSNATRSFNIGHDRFVDEVAVCDFIPHWPLNVILDASDLWQVRYNHRRGRDDNIDAVLLGLILSGLLYGGLHLLAWKMPFASRAECILWRFSGILIISTGLGFKGLQGFVEYLDNKDSLVSTLFFVFAWLFVFALCLGYLLARPFLVVECFLQLFRLPASAYETPAWPAYFPHIS